MENHIRPDWIAADWGSSRLRLWAMAGERVLAAAESADGMVGLAPDGFEPAFLSLAAGWLGEGATPALICGMAGARQGWVEAPYRLAPCAARADAAVAAPSHDPRLDVRILGGVSQAAPPDVMRGEETQIAGVLAGEPGFDGVLCLPGTHSKWVHVAAGEIVSFRTFMTGEMFALLSERSVLRHSVGAGWRDDAFAEAVAIAKPEALAARLFALRAESLLSGLDGAAARARLSGLLIGAELAAARPYWLGRDVAVIGSGPLSDAYVAALAAQGVPARAAPGEDLALKGLIAARHLLETRP